MSSKFASENAVAWGPEGLRPLLGSRLRGIDAHEPHRIFAVYLG